MTILVTGASGTIGSNVLTHLAGQGVDVRALTRDPAKAKFAEGITPVKGDMLDIEAMRAALSGVKTLFLINAVTSEELTQALLTLNLAREAGVKHVVYFSVFNGQKFTNVPHFAAKHTVEQMIEQFDMSATILRPNCFMQNDVWFKDAVLGGGVYPFPIGERGVSMVDARDIAEIAAKALLERERASEALPHEIINVVGPEALTGEKIAAIWSELLGKSVRYGGNDTAPFEAKMQKFGPSYAALDLRLMLDRFVQDGMSATPGDVDEMTRRLGRTPRNYADFARELLAQWQG